MEIKISVLKKSDFDYHQIPNKPGVYQVLLPTISKPCFLHESTGGHFKGEDPTVSIDELIKKWVDGTRILYIGKSVNLRHRIRLYIQFGQRKPVAKWGGRYIWQLAGADNLLLCWKETPDEDPADVEKRLIQQFKDNHDGELPAANLRNRYGFDQI